MNKLKTIETIDQLTTPVEPDVGVRVEELRQLKDGWLDGAGKALSSGGLDWFRSTFEVEYPADLPQPYLYPTPEGQLLLEWSLGDNVCSLEVDLMTRRSAFHSLNLTLNKESNKSFNLDDPTAGQELEGLLRTFRN